jgi:hydrogenase maturation factor
VRKDADEEKSDDDAEEKSDEDDDDLPKGMTKTHKDKLVTTYEGLEDNKVVNVKTGSAISKVSKDYVRKGKFVGPKDMKKVVEWCHENLGSESDEESKSDDAEEIAPGYTLKKLGNLKKAIEKCPKGKWVLVSTNKAMEKSDKNKTTYLWGKKFCVKKEGDGSKVFKAIEKAR